MAQKRGIKTWARVYVTNGYNIDLSTTNMAALLVALDAEVASDDAMMLCTQNGALALKSGGSIRTEPEGDPDNKGNTLHKVTVELAVDGIQAIATAAAQRELVTLTRDRVNVFVCDTKLNTVTKAVNVQLNKAHSTVIGEPSVDMWTGENVGEESEIFDYRPIAATA